MAMPQNRPGSQAYLEKRVQEYARVTHIPIDDLAWYQPPDQDASELTIFSLGKQRKYDVENFKLETYSNSQLDDIAHAIVSDLRTL